jgi:histidinol-phosphate aminotransferase
MGADSVHGGLDFAALQRLGPHACDFSSNVNPWGCSPRVKEALHDLPLSPYPDPACRDLRAALAAHEGVPSEEILCGNGSSELIWAVCRWIKRQKEDGQSRLVIPEPTFGEYATAACAAGMKVERFASTGPSLHFALDDLMGFAWQREADLVFLCSPNNPTGQTFPVRRIQEWGAVDMNALLVVDQAYREYRTPEEREEALDLRHTGRLLRLCCLTKAYGLAGVRLGYLVGPAALLQEIGRQLPSWSVSAVAQTAGIAAIQDQEWLETTLAWRMEASGLLSTQLAEAGFEVATRDAGFFLARVGRASEWRARLLHRGMVVRDCTSFGLPQYLRLSPSMPDACMRLVAAMREVREELCQVAR